MRSRRSGLGGRIAVAIVVAAALTGCTAQEADEPAPASSTAQPAPSASASASADIREDLVGDWVSPDDPDVTLTLGATLGLHGPADGPTGTLVRVDG